MKPLSQNALRAPASGIRKIFDLANKTPGCIRFIVGEPDFCTPGHIAQAGIDAIAQGRMRYTPNAGLPELRRLIAEKVLQRKGYAADPEREVMVTNGGMEALFLTMLALIEPGDEILMCPPLFSNYLGTAVSLGAVPVCVQCREENGFVVDPADLRAAVTSRTKAILINSPNNPTGSITGRAVLEEIAQLAEEYDLYVISDEVYQDYCYTGEPFVSFGSLPGMAKRTVLVESLSKTYAMTGWRIGYLAGPAPLVAQMIKLQEGVISSVNASAQYAAIEALSGPQDSVSEMIAVFKKRRDLLVAGVRSIPGLRCTPPGGAFYLFVNISASGLSSEEFALRLLSEVGVAVVPGSAFGPGGEGYIRISYVVSEADITEGIRRMAVFMQRLTGQNVSGL